MDSVMPTPLAYSRSSSLNSLNSFDVKSVHSEVASEYSHYVSACTSKTKKKKRRKNALLERILSDNDESAGEETEEEYEEEGQDECNTADTTQDRQANVTAGYNDATSTEKYLRNRNDPNDTYDEDEDDFDRLMPESPAAPADSSFVMQQRIKHKQLQMHCREKAAATMQCAAAAFLEQKTSVESIISRHDAEKHTALSREQSNG